jgi:hypothetical protein
MSGFYGKATTAFLAAMSGGENDALRVLTDEMEPGEMHMLISASEALRAAAERYRESGRSS